jgi:catechol 2,3-dioxygenase-like lactoylglutathione lyase family enzyme
MTDHFCVPVSDVSRSRDFHRQVLGALGMTEDMVFPGASVFGLGRPRRLLDPLQVERSIAGGRPMQDRCRSGRSAPNLHIAFRAPPCSHVERLAEMAQMFGGVVVHSPRALPEGHDSYYAAFVRDPDGHNIEAVCSEPT